MQLNYDDLIQWLAHRFTCDAEARHPGIEHQFLAFFEQHQTPLKVVDVGSGTGANVRYYFDRIPHEQEWILIEQNEQLRDECCRSLVAFAQERGYHWQQQDGTFLLTDDQKTATVQLMSGRIEHIEQLADLARTDVVTANAVFDLLSFEQFDTLVGKLVQHEVCLLATLNYYETSFLPFSEEDHRFMRWYHMHMKRPQPTGIAMGPDCSEEMLDLLAQHHMMIEQEGSQWHLKKNATTMHHYLLHFIEHAVAELSLSADEQRDFDTWLTHRKSLCRQRQLEIIVDHSDIFAYPQ